MTVTSRAALAAALGVATPAAALGQLNATTVGTGFSSPVFATSPAGSPTLYVVQQGGQVRTLNPTTGATATFLDISSGSGLLAGGERGLLGMAFHPDYATNGKFYLQYTATGSTSESAVRVEEYTATNGVADPASRRTIIQFDTPKSGNAANHNAGWLGFNPTAAAADPTRGYLYVTAGDSGSGNDPLNVAQDRNSLQGKMLRIDVNNPSGGRNYGIPASGNLPAGTGREEVYAYGLRNPFRNSFDRGTGDLYVADVGQNRQEEINFVRGGSAGGQNFGWRVREGLIKTPGVGDADLAPAARVDPVFAYEHSTGFGQSITGGYVYRGTATDDAGNALDGTYFFADFVSGKVFSLRTDGTTATGFVERTAEFGLTARANSISSFGEDGLGNLYMIDINGTVYRMIPVPEPACAGLLAAAGVLAWRRFRFVDAGRGAG